jgi:hypothetical protein
MVHPLSPFLDLSASRSAAAVLVLAICQPLLALDRYPPPTLLEIVGRADLVVVGKVVAVEQGTYRFQIEETVLGKPRESCRIVQVHDTCGQRPFPYEVGQRMIVLLHDGPGTLHPVTGRGSESLLDGDRVICSFQVPNPRAEFPPGQQPATRVPLRDLKQAIIDFPDQFRAVQTTAVGTVYDHQIGKSSAANQFAARSTLHRLLIEQALATRQVPPKAEYSVRDRLDDSK